MTGATLFDHDPAGQAAAAPVPTRAEGAAGPAGSLTPKADEPAEIAPPDRLVAGCDPGLAGAFALIHPSGTIEVVDMPVRPAPTKGEEIDWHAVKAILRGWDLKHVYLERVHAAGGKAEGRQIGGNSMFKFGGAFYGMEAALECLDIPYSLIAPATWKRAAGLIGSDKDYARTVAMRQFPGQAGLFKRKKDVGRADAVLIALAGEQRRGG